MFQIIDLKYIIWITTCVADRVQAGRCGQPVRGDDRPGLCGAPVVSAMVKLTSIDRVLAAAAAAGCLIIAAGAQAQSAGNFSTLSTTGTATLNGDVLMCSGRPWIDVKCPSLAGGAVGNGSNDDTA